MAATTNGTSDDGHLASLWARYEHTKLQDVMKNVLLEDVISRYENLINTHNSYVKEREEERVLVKTFRQREQQLQANVEYLQRLMNSHPFILVLIDGDGMIFNTNFLRAGEAGGKQAANVLNTAVAEWAAANVIDCPADVKVVTRVYANVKGLAEVCTKAGLVSQPSMVEDFTKGFTRGRTLFDFVDVGYGKDRADGKVAEIFKLHLYDYHCRQILLGCSHDNGFARLLEQYITDVQAVPRVTLLEGVRFEKGLAVLPFRTKKFAGLFRETKINLNGPSDLLSGMNERKDSRSLNAASDVFTPRTNTPFTPIFSPGGSIPQLDGNGLASSLSHLRTQSITSSANSLENSNGNASTNGNSWANLAKASAELPFTDMTRKVSDSEPAKIVRRNRAGQRLDDPLDSNREEVQRLKKVKLCNQHYIGNGCCHFNAGREDKCPHRHDYNMTPQERHSLRTVARETPCKKGHECDDLKCIYGHACPFPLSREGSMRGIECLNGDACRFPRSMHGMDTVAVKLIKVTGAF